MTQNYDLVSALASEHLGKKAGDYSDFVDIVTVKPDLLVSIPRELNRVDYDIDNNTFVGFDTWHGFEVSALTNNGFPVSGLAKVIIPSDSPCIIESKSMKLYWNSFNMSKIAEKRVDVIRSVEQIASRHLTEAAGAPVKVKFFTEHASQPHGLTGYANLDNFDYSHVSFDSKGADAELLQPSDIPRIRVRTGNLRSNCRVTHQPDFGDLYIEMTGKSTPTKESLMQYIVSFRKENHFHEECVEMIYKALSDKFGPDTLVVTALYTRRGGWNICPSRASHEELLPDALGNTSVSHTNGNCLYRQ